MAYTCHWCGLKWTRINVLEINIKAVEGFDFSTGEYYLERSYEPKFLFVCDECLRLIVNLKFDELASRKDLKLKMKR